MAVRRSQAPTPLSPGPAHYSSIYALDDEQLSTISASLVDYDMPRNLDDVPEELETGAPLDHQGMYLNRSAANSASTFHPGAGGGGSGSGRSTPIPGTPGASSYAGFPPTAARPRRTTSNRTMGRQRSSEQMSAMAGPPSERCGGSVGAGPGGVNGVRRSSSNLAKGAAGARQAGSERPIQRYRSTPRLVFDKELPPAPTTGMHWSKAPVWGSLPARPLRSHSATLVDTVVWIIGGNEDVKDKEKEREREREREPPKEDEKESKDSKEKEKEKERRQDILCFDTESMQWSHPETLGEGPPPCRAHTATLVDKKIVLYGGGLGSQYFDHVFILDVPTRRWTQPHILEGPQPASRRAHTAGYHNGRLWIFGGGNGMSALDDVWTLNLGPGQQGIVENGKRGLKWEEVQTFGRRPGRRGYHSASFVSDKMIVVGGSDGKECFTDIWILNLETLAWSSIAPHPPIFTQKRLSHSATLVGSYIFIIGGHNGDNYVSDVLLLNLVSLQFEPRTIYGKPFSIRGNHATVLADSRLFLFGGYNGLTALDDVHILDLSSYAYLPQVTSFSILDGDAL